MSVSLRVDRTSSRAFRCVSKSATLRLTVASGIPSLRPVAEKLPVGAAYFFPVRGVEEERARAHDVLCCGPSRGEPIAR